MANVAETIRNFKQQGYLTKTDIESQLSKVKPSARRRALDKLPMPTVVVNGVGLWPPSVCSEVIDKTCPVHAFNSMATAFICGARPPDASKLRRVKMGRH